jgi:methylglyoxal synthase
MTLALIAHDRCKEQMVEFVSHHLSFFSTEPLVGTKTTGGLLKAQLNIDIDCKLSGPQGGDLQIGAMVAEGKISAVFFLRDVLTAQPHEPDIAALMRICDVHSVPIATNLGTAELLIKQLSRD